MSAVSVIIGGEAFGARFQDDLAPRTCAWFRQLFPWSDKLIHVRWSGEACWIPMGSIDLGLPYENATSHPGPGQFIFYPGDKSESEILLAYGSVSFSSKAGQLAGNPFLVVTEKLDRLAELGPQILYGGARQIEFRDLG